MIYYDAIDPVALQLGPLALHWYGITYVFALLGCLLMALHHSKTKSFLDAKSVEDLWVFVAFGVVLGGRVGYCLFYGFDLLLKDPLWLFRIWEGGMSFHGGLLGVAIGILYFTRTRNVPYGDCLDFVAVVVPIGLFCGRIGNFINQELWGRPTDVPWSVVFSTDLAALPRHPSQLYEAALEGIVLFALMKYFYTKNLPRWGLSAVFACGYGFMRFFVEYFREPDAPVWLSLTRGQLLCVPLICLGLYWLVYLTYNDRRKALRH